MPNTPTTPASVASQLTDEEILKLAEQYELTASQTVATDSIRNHYTNSAAVLRDYVRLRKLADAVKARVDFDDTITETPYKSEPFQREIISSVGGVVGKSFCPDIATSIAERVNAIEDVRRLLAKAEKGEAE